MTLNQQSTIRTARHEDHPALQALYQRAASANPADAALLRSRPDFLTLPDNAFDDGKSFLCETDGQITGFATLGKAPDGQPELTALFTDPDFWNQGLGRMLVEEARNRASAAGGRWLWVDGNPNAAGFYRSVGFVSAGPAVLDGAKGLRLRLRLGDAPERRVSK